MAEVNINEINAKGDVDFDQAIDSDTLIAGAGGVAVGGSISDSALNTGRNSGILAGDDVDLDDSIVGDGNTQLNDSDVGAFAARGDATNISGENVNTGSGTLTDVDTRGGDAQVVNGNGNDLVGDVDANFEGADGPINFTVGDNNRSNALEDNSTNIDDSFNTDNSIEDSFNTDFRDSFNTRVTDTDVTETHLIDSFNTTTEDNDLTKLDFESNFEDNSVFEDNDQFSAELDVEKTDVDISGDDNEVDVDT
ncbi:MAG: hypothetical protein ACKV2O_20030 [Acidimicrobiales bacterium]